MNSVDELVKGIASDISTVPDGTHLDEMKEKMRQILGELGKGKSTFNQFYFISIFEKYTEVYKRILYSEVTVYIYALYEDGDEKKLPIFISNVESILEYYVEKDSRVENENTKIFIKLWDHINLANNQIDKLKMSDEAFAKRADPIIEQLNVTTRDLEETKKGIITQLISIVGIFTALAFVGFGGISMLNSVFSMESKGIMGIIVLGSLCGIVIMNLIFIFIYFISKMSHTSIKSCGHTDSCKCSILTRYPFFYLSNAIMIEIFFVSTVLYVARSSDPIYYFIGEYHWITIIIGTALIGVFAIIVLFKCSKKATEKI